MKKRSMLRKRNASTQKGTRKSAFFVSAPRRKAKPLPQKLRYIAFHKPYGVLSQFTSDAGKRTLAEFGFPAGVYSVGRLDEHSEGLLLLTNYNTLKHDLTDPQAGHLKTYLAQVERIPTQSALDNLINGVLLDGKRTRPAAAHLLSTLPELPDRPVPIRHRVNVTTAWIEISISEGKNRQIRRMTAAVGHPTLRLVRIAIAGLQLDGLRPGEWNVISKSSILEK